MMVQVGAITPDISRKLCCHSGVDWVDWESLLGFAQSEHIRAVSSCPWEGVSVMNSSVHHLALLQTLISVCSPVGRMRGVYACPRDWLLRKVLCI